MFLILLAACHTAADRSFMHSCNTDDDCKGDLVCMDYDEFRDTGPSTFVPGRFCTRPCTEDADCPEWKCGPNPWYPGRCDPIGFCEYIHDCEA